jgi:CheY-like chemotaxis protein
LEFSNACTPFRNILALEWVLQSVSASWSAPAVESGLNLSPEGVRRFSLPFPPPDPAESQTPVTSAHIVLIEDNRADVLLVREALDQHNVRCEVTVISDGEAAIKFIDQIDAGLQPRPDLVIIDLNLPKKPGKEVLKRMRACDACRDVAVVILTSSDARKDKDDVAPFAPLHYLKKPSQLDDFLILGALFRQIVQQD